MSEPIRLTTPLTQDKVRSLHIGDRVLISGTIYAARDAAHKRMVETLDRGEPGRRPQAVWTPTRRA